MAETPAGSGRSGGRGDSTSTKVTQQRALTTANGTSWLVIGGILTVICGGLLFAMQWLRAPAVALVGLVIVIVLYAAMVVIRFAVSADRARLWSLAALTVLIVVTFFVCGGIVTATEWNAV